MTRGDVENCGLFLDWHTSDRPPLPTYHNDKEVARRNATAGKQVMIVGKSHSYPLRIGNAVNRGTLASHDRGAVAWVFSGRGDRTVWDQHALIDGSRRPYPGKE